MIRLRGHHLLCLHGFRGLGYSEGFIANMARIHEAVMNGSGASVMLITGPDDICTACPNTDEPGCSNAGRAALRDSCVLDVLGISPETVAKSDEVMRLVRERFDMQTLERVCAGCRWFKLSYCLEGVLGTT